MKSINAPPFRLNSRTLMFNTNLDTTEFSHSLSLDASGGSASRNLLNAAEGALIRAAASTQTLCV
jgi:hypothetical protein